MTHEMLMRALKIREERQARMEQTDKRLGIHTYGNIETYVTKDRTRYHPTRWDDLDTLIQTGYISAESKVVDIGCGKGRVAFYLNSQLGCKVVGVECVPKIFTIAEDNLDRYGRDRGVHFVCADARECDFGEADTFYMFRPFSVDVLRDVMRKVVDSPHAKRVICYYLTDEYEKCMNEFPLRLVEMIPLAGIERDPFYKLAIYEIERR